MDSDEDINDRDGEKTTGLIWAVVAGHESLADSARSRSALHWAALNGDLKTVQLLLSDEMVDMNCTDSEGRTPLHLAVSKGHTKVLQILLGHQQVDVNHISMWAGHYWIVPYKKAMLASCKYS